MNDTEHTAPRRHDDEPAGVRGNGAPQRRHGVLGKQAIEDCVAVPDEAIIGLPDLLAAGQSVVGRPL